ncbi:TOMM precursor leader peptide-binding protein [uncultured Corynebacterium sp.]|uniref:TOMM precursor leader peptide-binding protein n=1 Tax=uncultured Corynebacterium sp. TaxID=159447 RepID=UPI0025F11823|nr:TOMM precursor leader peptide-binding protein [uncultured Corynebacterium sp.]
MQTELKAEPVREPVLLHRHVAVLLRPGGRIQFGSEAARCLVFPLDDDIAPGPVFSAVLAATRGACLVTSLAATQLPPDLVAALVAELRRAGLIDQPRSPGRLTVIGRDGLRHRVADTMKARGWATASRLLDRATRAWLTTAGVDEIGTVVLTGFEVPDVTVLATLRGRGIPHLSAVLRDGVGVVGPWVADPSAPCPACAEAHRRDDDAARGVLALQLAGMVATAPPETVAATVATIEAQVAVHAGASPEGTNPARPAPLRGAEVVVDPRGLRGGVRHLLPHPRCPVCSAATAGRGGLRAQWPS